MEPRAFRRTVRRRRTTSRVVLQTTTTTRRTTSLLLITSNLAWFRYAAPLLPTAHRRRITTSINLAAARAARTPARFPSSRPELRTRRRSATPCTPARPSPWTQPSSATHSLLSAAATFTTATATPKPWTGIGKERVRLREQRLFFKPEVQDRVRATTTENHSNAIHDTMNESPIITRYRYAKLLAILVHSTSSRKSLGGWVL